MQQDAHSIVTALTLLAGKLEGEGHPLQSLQCLRALLQSRLLPDQHARVRLQAGKLMLQHTVNHKEAYKELMAAQQVASSLVGNNCLKCEICCWLASFHHLQGQTSHQLQALQQGLQLCEAAPSGSTERPLLHRWAAHLLAKRVNALWDSGEGLARTRSAVEAGSNFAKQHGLLDMELLFEVLHMQLDLVELQAASPLLPPHALPAAAPPPTAATPTGTTCSMDAAIKLRFVNIDTLVERACEQQEQQQQQQQEGHEVTAAGAPAIPSGFLRYVALHTSLMQALYELGVSRIDKLMVVDDAGRRSPLFIVDNMRAILEDCQGKDLGYTWLSLPEAEAAISLCGALLCLYYGRSEQAAEQVCLGKAAVQRWLEELQMAGPGVSERSMDNLGLWLSRTPLVLRMQLCIIEAHLQLCNSELSKARDTVREVLMQVKPFPNHMRSMVGHAHLLAGQYAHAVEEWDAAAQHFREAQHLLQHVPTHLLASAFTALTLCCMPNRPAGDVEGTQEAVDALGDVYVELTSTATGSLGERSSEPLELVLAQAATALIKLRMGYSKEARQRMSAVLRTAHGRLMHHCLVSTCMAFSVPILKSQGDTKGAESMLASAQVLARGSLRTRCHLQHLLEVVSDSMPGLDTEKARQEHETMAAELAAKVAEAQATDPAGHSYILRFGLS